MLFHFLFILYRTLKNHLDANRMFSAAVSITTADCSAPISFVMVINERSAQINNYALKSALKLERTSCHSFFFLVLLRRRRVKGTRFHYIVTGHTIYY